MNAKTVSDTFTKMGSDPITVFDRRDLGRREFLGVALATAALPVASLIPAGPVAAAVTGPACLADWTIDDQWTGYPRYAESIGCGRPRRLSRKPDIHPADEPFIPH